MAGIRRSWDKDYYEAKAKDRIERGEDVEDKSKGKTVKSAKEEFQPASKGAEGPAGSERAFISARKGKIDLESKVGKTQVINPNIPENAAAAGWYCEVCACLLKDSICYLDHINGKRHQKALGFSMRVERADANTVKERLKTLKRKIVDVSKTTPTHAIDDYETRLAQQVVEEENKKKLRKEQQLAKKIERDAAELESADPEIAELLGFGGFGGSKKG
mmetsp:Transcript_37429/g.38110  ORF Transcript_37429/g.38110 Transcript_37429/m.38110 type:complete len:218 (-) Transcript_37429:56-709(-)|eukprot:CAMPEP_0182417768 /NCGR_PEP_ID=MMETSP1167-20130531/2203_1 /TAXON_ID=2988 /ORGANISM="Mallomonas Sp, Strain CCMP3275" /LENGTH=217 /DNA_ID=CAMNT_0024591527 /DNA_START=51 /DNA_END=704 /DNA_ORIENTATION=+